MKNENASENEFGVRLTLCMTYMLTSILGVPLWIIGTLFHSNYLMGAWREISYTFAALFLDKEIQRNVKESPVEKPHVKDFIQASLDMNHLLCVSAIGRKYTRFVLHTVESGIRKRIELTDIFPDELPTLGLEDSLQSAMAYTMRQIEHGVHANKLRNLHRQVNPAEAVSEKKPEQKARKNSSAEKMAPTVTEKFVQAGSDDSESIEPKRSKKAKGKVAFAGNQVVNVNGKKPYETFAVILADGNQQYTFSGIHLAEQYAEGVFEEGDLVEIQSAGKISFTVEKNGEIEHRTKNTFNVKKFN